jgi:hypothetical protein
MQDNPYDFHDFAVRQILHNIRQNAPVLTNYAILIANKANR